MAEIIAQEAKALGVNQLFAPVVDLAREPRFGRVSYIFLLKYFMTIGYPNKVPRSKKPTPRTPTSLVKSATTTSKECKARMFHLWSNISPDSVSQSRELIPVQFTVVSESFARRTYLIPEDVCPTNH